MADMKNTFVDIELETGETVKATLNYYYLLQLKGRNKGVYDEYNRIMTKSMSEELDMVTVTFAAYLCAQIAEGNDEPMGFEEFLSVLSPDREYMGEVFGKLTNPKKAKASAKHS